MTLPNPSDPSEPSHRGATDRTHSRSAFFAGVRDTIGIVPSYLPFGMVCGVASVNAGLTKGAAIALPALVYAGSAQAVLLQFLQNSAALWVAILSGCVINLRMAVYSAALAPKVRHFSAPKRMLIAAFLVKQPDFGQTALFGAVWLVQAFLAGMSLWILAGAICAALGGLVVAYLMAPHVTQRIDKFLTGGGDTYQIDRALDCFRAGGLFGVGPGEGQMKFRLPEAQTDYIFSVIGEEFGAIACLALACLFLAIVVRVLLQLLEEEDPFIFLAASGLVVQFGAQAMINMAVNLALLPSKGMTLPFVSHGGSSFLALAMGMGLLLALTRRNKFLNASPYAERWGAAAT